MTFPSGLHVGATQALKAQTPSVMGRLDRWVRAGFVPGAAAAVCFGDEPLMAEAGHAGDNQEFRRDTIFRLYEMGEVIVAVAAMRLVEQGHGGRSLVSTSCDGDRGWLSGQLPELVWKTRFHVVSY